LHAACGGGLSEIYLKGWRIAAQPASNEVAFFKPRGSGFPAAKIEAERLSHKKNQTSFKPGIMRVEYPYCTQHCSGLSS
jgi:hypothetical protein